MRSELCIYDLANGKIEIVLTTDRLIEAPNWSNDGKTLIVNGDGHIYCVALAGKAEMVRIDTGFAVTCNNDHGLSPDGREMVISDGTENGQSCIYILPASMTRWRNSAVRGWDGVEKIRSGGPISRM